MSANVATNFPPQTYSSSFFLNALTDDVGVPSNSSKKRARSTDNADSSNAVLDCFISTMRNYMCHLEYVGAVLLLVFQLAHCSDDLYKCTESPKAVVRTFSSINDYQKNTLHFLSKFNFVAFNVSEMSHLEKNIFITYESNYIVKLMLNHKNIETIDKGAFNELFCVKILLLQNNRIAELENGTFDGLYSVEELYLSDNNILIVSNETFKNLRYLRNLDLSHNKILQLTEGTFDSLPSLWELRLDHNVFSIISPDWFRRTTRLNRLYLNNNQIFSLNGSEFKYLTRLDLLDLSGNSLTMLVVDLFRPLGRLSELNIANNRLTYLNVASLPNLQRIHLENNDWQCADLKIIVKQLTESIIEIVNSVIVHDEIDLAALTCNNGTELLTTSTPSTTFIPWYPSKEVEPSEVPYGTPAARIDNHQSDELLHDTANILSAISELRTVMIVLIIIVVIVLAIDILLRIDTCSRIRSRVFVNRNTESSLPLLLR